MKNRLFLGFILSFGSVGILHPAVGPNKTSKTEAEALAQCVVYALVIGNASSAKHSNLMFAAGLAQQRLKALDCSNVMKKRVRRIVKKGCAIDLSSDTGQQDMQTVSQNLENLVKSVGLSGDEWYVLFDDFAVKFNEEVNQKTSIL